MQVWSLDWHINHMVSPPLGLAGSSIRCPWEMWEFWSQSRSWVHVSQPVPFTPAPLPYPTGRLFTHILQSFLPGAEPILNGPCVWPHPNSWVAPARISWGSSVPSNPTLICFPDLEVQGYKPQEAFSSCPRLPRQCQHRAVVWIPAAPSVGCHPRVVSLDGHPKALLFSEAWGVEGERQKKDSDPVPALL